MTKRKRANKSQFKKTSDYKKKKQSNTNGLEQYLSIIDDLYGKLLNTAKYPDISKTDEEEILTIARWCDFDDFEKSKLWSGDDIPEDTPQILKDRIINTYQSWGDWIQGSIYTDRYLEFVESLHPATLNSLPKIVPEFQTPGQIRVSIDLETAYDCAPEKYSKYGCLDIGQLKEVEPARYRKLLNDRIFYHKRMFDSLNKEKERVDVWPRSWMQEKAIQENLSQRKHLIPILNYITNHAFLRTDPHTKEYGSFYKDGKEVDYIVAKINRNKIADFLGVSPDTVSRYIRAMKNAGFIQPLKNPYYSLGYWNKYSRVFFLKSSIENRKKLRGFKLK